MDHPPGGAALPKPRLAFNGSDLFQRFIAFLDVSPQSAATYSRALRRFFVWLEETGLDRPGRSDLPAFKTRLKQSCKPATIHIYLTCLRLFFRWTAQEGLYPDVADHLKGVKPDQGHKKDYLTAAQARAVLERIDRSSPQGLRDYALLSLMLTAGLRAVEISRADWGDLRVAGGGPVLYLQGKGRAEKLEFVKLAEPVDKALRQYRAAQGRLSPQAALFGSLAGKNLGRPLTTRSISRIVKERLRAAGFDSERLSAHSLRHTAGTLNLLAGGTLEETRQLLRHSSLNTTLIYSHHLERLANDSEARIAASIWA